MPKGIYPRNTPTAPTYTWERHLPKLIASISTEADAIAYLVGLGILQDPKIFTCYYCGYVGCRVKSKKNLKGLKCNRGSCGRSLSLLRGTIFAGSKAPINQILYISSFFLSLAPPSVVITQLHCSSNTVTHWYSKFRKWISDQNQIFYGEDAKKEHVMDRARKKDAFEHEAVAVWRERNIESLWDAFISALKFHNPEVVGAFDTSFNDGDTDLTVLQNTPLHPLLPPMDSFVEDDGNMPTIEDVNREDAHIMNESMEMAQLKMSDETVDDPHPESVQMKMSDAIMDHSHQEHKEYRARHTAIKKRSASAQLSFGESQQSSQHGYQVHQSNEQSSDNHYELTQKRAKRKHSIPTFLDICRLVPTEEKAIEYLTFHGILTSPKDTVCCHCGYKGFRQKEKNIPKSLKCNRCSKGQSIARSTFFQNTKTTYRAVLQLAAHWLHNIPRNETISQLKCSSATLTEYYRKFRKLIEKTMGDELRAMALTADKKAMGQEIPKGARRSELEEHYCVVLWREVNGENLWDAFLLALRVYVPDDTSHENRDGTNGVWVDCEKGIACCNYHLKLNSKARSD